MCYLKVPGLVVPGVPTAPLGRVGAGTVVGVGVVVGATVGAAVGVTAPPVAPPTADGITVGTPVGLFFSVAGSTCVPK